VKRRQAALRLYAQSEQLDHAAIAMALRCHPQELVGDFGNGGHSWVEEPYLRACAEAGGAVPEDVERFLPWNLSEQDPRRWSQVGAESGADTS
jgi:hypothetical protein